jgi:hypothetical protein
MPLVLSMIIYDDILLGTIKVPARLLAGLNLEFSGQILNSQFWGFQFLDWVTGDFIFSFFVIGRRKFL